MLSFLLTASDLRLTVLVCRFVANSEIAFPRIQSTIAWTVHLPVAIFVFLFISTL